MGMGRERGSPRSQTIGKMVKENRHVGIFGALGAPGAPKIESGK